MISTTTLPVLVVIAQVATIQEELSIVSLWLTSIVVSGAVMFACALLLLQMRKAVASRARSN